MDSDLQETEPVKEGAEEPLAKVAEPVKENAEEPLPEETEPLKEGAEEPLAEVAEPVKENAEEPLAEVAEPLKGAEEPLIEETEPLKENAEEPSAEETEQLEKVEAVNMNETFVAVGDVGVVGGEDRAEEKGKDAEQEMHEMVSEEAEPLQVNVEVGESSPAVGDVEVEGEGKEVDISENIRGWLQEAVERLPSVANIADEIRAWLDEAMDKFGVSELSSLEEDMRGLILEALESLGEDEEPEQELTPADITALLIEALLKLPGDETGLDESRWILREVRTWVNTAMGVKTFMTKQTSTSTIDALFERMERGLGVEPPPSLVTPEIEERRERRRRRVAAAAPISRPPYQRRFTRQSPMIEDAQPCEGVSTVTFLMGEKEMHSREYPLSIRVDAMKADLAEVFGVSQDALGLSIEGAPMLDTLSLGQLGVKPTSSVKIQCFSTEPMPVAVVSVKPSEVRCVRVQVSEDTVREVRVEVQDRSVRKLWVGGYRDKGTHTEYHHAFSQTQPPPSRLKPEEKSHRDTQTADLREEYQNTVCERATQMWRRDHYIPCEGDRILTPGVFITQGEIDAERDLLSKVLTIQRYTRAWLLRRWAAKHSREYRRIKALEEEAERRRLEEKLRRLKRRLTRKTYPRSRADFDMLYHMVEMWRRAEVERVYRMRGEASRRAEIYMLVQKQVLILSCIERHRVRVRDERLAAREIDFLEKSAAPVTWTGYKGATVSMETGACRQARELKQLYYILCNRDVSVEERVNALMCVRHAVKPFDNCVAVLDLLQLIDRETDCLCRGLTHDDLDALRRLTRRKYLEFLRDPAVNEDADKPPKGTAAPGALRFCQLCRKLLPQSRFRMDTNTRVVKQCISCCWVDQIARPRPDFGPYRLLMRALRKEEARRCCYSSVAFLMQEVDFFHLINNIWHGHSIIDKSYDLDDLVLARWRVAEDWTPWNCVLLAYREARAHYRLRKSLEETYEVDLIEDVMVKHQEARVHFRQLRRFDTRFKESARWFKADLTISYKPKS